MDSPDQGAEGIPLSSVRIKGDSLLVEAKAIGGKFSGRFENDTTIIGEWFQGTGLPLQLKKLSAGEAVAERKRPQTPKPPFPYKSEDVVYFNKNKSIQYGATITSPQGAGSFPAIILITGSGQENRDEELFGHKPFAVLADYLTRKGYVIMRVDDRGIGQTTGDVKNATSKDFANDVITGLDYLKGLPQVNKAKIGLLGHSEGGMIAQMVAAQRPDVDFVIMLAGPGLKGMDVLLTQNRAILAKQGLSAKALDSYMELYKSLVPEVSSSDSSAKTRAVRMLENWLAKTPAETIATATGIKTEADKKTFLDRFSTWFAAAWTRYFIHYDPDVYVQKMKAKMLALNGEKDVQIVAGPNLAALKASLQKGGNKASTVVELKGLNHFFQHCTECTIAEYSELEETIAPEALETIAAWLRKNVK